MILPAVSPVQSRRPATILIADDDPEDRELAERALRSTGLTSDLRFVEDGEQLMDYLRREGAFVDDAVSPVPQLVLLDIRMPGKSGLECLAEIRADARLRALPVVVLTTSRADEDVYRSYELGVNSFIAKPVTFTGFVDAMAALSRYWFDVVELPNAEQSG